MSITETPVIVSPADVEFAIDLGDEHPHLECCRAKRFFCGRPYHPELSATAMNSPEEEVCEICIEVMNNFWCWRGHQHCPIPLLGGFICPDA